MPRDPSQPRHLLAPLAANWWLPVAVVLLVMTGWWVEGNAPSWFLAGGGGWDPFWGRIAILVGINLVLAVSLQLINGVAGQFSLGHAGFMAVGAYLGGYAVSVHGGRTNAAGDVIDFAHPGGAALYLFALLFLSAAAGAVLFFAVKLLRLTGRLHRKVPALIGWGLVAWVVLDVLVSGKSDGKSLGAMTSMAFLADAVQRGYAGLLTAGKPVADLITRLTPEDVRKPVSLVVSMVGGGLAAAVAGLVVGIPTLRLKGDYLAIATLGFAQIIVVAILNSEPLGRATGLSVPSFPVDAQRADPEVGLYPVNYFPWVYGAALVTVLAVWRIQHSPKGRALQCLREDEVAAVAVGIDVTAHKVMAFVIGAFFAGVGGSLFAHYDGYLNPNQFSLQRSIELVVIVTLGGLGSVRGTVVVCVLLTLLQPTLQTAPTWMPGWVPEWVERGAVAANEYRLVIYAFLLIVAMLLKSTDVWGWLKARVLRRRRVAAGGLT